MITKHTQKIRALIVVTVSLCSYYAEELFEKQDEEGARDSSPAPAAILLLLLLLLLHLHQNHFSFSSHPEVNKLHPRATSYFQTDYLPSCVFCAVPDRADNREGGDSGGNINRIGRRGGIILICDGVFAALYPCLPPWRRVGVTLPLGKSEVHFGS